MRSVGEGRVIAQIPVIIWSEKRISSLIDTIHKACPGWEYSSFCSVAKCACGQYLSPYTNCMIRYSSRKLSPHTVEYKRDATAAVSSMQRVEQRASKISWTIGGVDYLKPRPPGVLYTWIIIIHQ